MSWHEIQLGDCIDVKHGFAFDGKSFSDEGDYILLTPGNCQESGGLKLKGDREKYFLGDFPQEFLLCSGDLLVVMTDLINTAPILGGSLRIPEDGKFLHNQRLGLVQIRDEGCIDKTFLFYLLNTHDYRGQVRGSASGATVRHTSPGRIKACWVRVPRDVRVQARIGAMLAAYDDLIENSQRRMVLLEEAARLLYREWFVLLRFPGHEHTPRRSGIPAGWSRKPLSDLTAFLRRGITPAYDDESDSMVINQKCIRDGRLDLSFARRQSREFKPERAAREGDVLINSTGEGTLGRVAPVISAIPNCTVDTHVTIVRPREGLGRAFFALAVMAWEPRFSTMGRGATNQTELSPDQIGECELLIPGGGLQREFEDFAGPMFRQATLLAQQSVKLRAARDLLLPRLMSGEITV